LFILCCKVGETNIRVFGLWKNKPLYYLKSSWFFTRDLDSIITIKEEERRARLGFLFSLFFVQYSKTLANSFVSQK
jgi:hypothetical protein